MSAAAPETRQIAITSSSPKPKRGEIEGLRTVAALLVAVYHIWFARVSGGVDVFFVVTGFFITLSLTGHISRYGSIRIGEYLGRITRRVWPAAALVLLAVLLLTATLTPTALRDRNLLEVLASALYLENWYLAANSIDYLNAADPPTPVQHYWAMSVQGQFYLAWLLLALLAWMISRRFTSFRRIFAVLLVAVLLLSFAWSLWHTAQQQPVAYFDTTARLWEFAAGSLVALLGTRALLSGIPAALASWGGLIGLLLCGALLPVQSSFPGVAALWPVSCAILLLISTRAGERRWSATRILAARPLVWAGGFAFTIYLWHWPLLIGFRYLTGLNAQPDLLTGTLIIAIAVVLAWLTHQLIEKPVGRQPRGSRRLFAALLVTWMVVVGTAGSAALASGRTGVSEAAAPSTAACAGADAILHPSDCAIDGNPDNALRPERAQLLKDTGEAYRCYTVADAAEITLCSAGSGATRVALLGNSHAAMLGPELQNRADALGWTLDVMTGNGCVWSLQRAGDPDVSPKCENRLQEQEDLLFGTPSYDIVVFAGGRRLPSDQDSLDRMAENWRSLQATGAQIVVVQDNPRLEQQQVDCVLTVSDALLRAGDCDIDTATALSAPDNYAAVAEQVGAEIVQTTDLYCTEDRCPTVIGDVIVYRDAHHITASYTQSTIPIILERLLAAVGKRTTVN